MSRKKPALTALLHLVCERFEQDRCMQIASSLTFTTLLAIVPVVAIVLTVVAAFPVFSSLIAQVQSFVVANLVPSSVNAVAVYAERFSRNAAGLTAAGIVFLGITAVMLAYTIECAFNDIWRVTWQRRLLRRILMYWVVLLAGPLLIGASLSLTSYLVSLSLNIVGKTAGMTIVLLKGVPLLLTAAALSLLYFAVPNRDVAVRDALAGGALAGAGFEAMKQAFGFYVTHFPTDQMIYGAFATVPVFLLWIYLSWLIVLAGAVLVAALPEWRENAAGTRHAAGGDFLHALRALELLCSAQLRGETVPTARLHAVVKLRIDRLEWLLAVLERAGVVARTGGAGWRLRRDAGNITVLDIYRQFVFDAVSPAAGGPAGLEARVRALAAHGSAGMEVPLSQFFAADADAAG